MRFLMLILATVALAAPLRWIGAASCAACACGSGAPAVNDGHAAAEEVDCCGRAIAPSASAVDAEGSLPDRHEPGEGSKQSPCDDCGCPLRCCLGSPTVPLDVPPAVGIDIAGDSGATTGAGAQSAPAPPNLLGLKRPPRFRATT